MCHYIASTDASTEEANTKEEPVKCLVHMLATAIQVMHIYFHSYMKDILHGYIQSYSFHSALVGQTHHELR